MATLHVIYDPTDRLVIPQFDQVDQLNAMRARFAKLHIRDDLPHEAIGATAGRLALLLLDQLKPLPEATAPIPGQSFRVRVPAEYERTELPIYVVHDEGLDIWSLTTIPDRETRWPTEADARIAIDRAPYRIKHTGIIEGVTA